MGITKRAQYKVFNGTDFDTIHFETDEINLVNQIQNIQVNGYRQLPGGLILQWGGVDIHMDSTHFASGTVKFPITFPRGVLSTVATCIGIDSTVNQMAYINVSCRALSADSFYVCAEDERNAISNNYINVNWIAIGW